MIGSSRETAGCDRSETLTPPPAIPTHTPVAMIGLPSPSPKPPTTPQHAALH